jgi:hypothetical protein
MEITENYRRPHKRARKVTRTAAKVKRGIVGTQAGAEISNHIGK